MRVERPTGVTAAAAAFLLAGAYLVIVGLAMLARPGLVAMAAGAGLLGGLELAGPYMFLLVGGLGTVIALGLWRLHRWARWLAILAAVIGVVMRLPDVSSAMLDFRMGKLVWAGFGTIVRVMIVWYLFQQPVGEAFAPK
jgi:multidrug transporter EmrE-like cation transporter